MKIEELKAALHKGNNQTTCWSGPYESVVMQKLNNWVRKTGRGIYGVCEYGVVLNWTLEEVAEKLVEDEAVSLGVLGVFADEKTGRVCLLIVDAIKAKSNQVEKNEQEPNI